MNTYPYILKAHKALLTYFNILRFEMFLAGRYLVLYLPSEIRSHFSCFRDLSKPFASPFRLRFILRWRQLPNADSLGSPTRTTSKDGAVVTWHRLSQICL